MLAEEGEEDRLPPTMRRRHFAPPLITEVRQGSPAEAAGIIPGDRLLSINRRTPADVLEYMQESDASELVLELQRGGEKLRCDLNKRAGEPAGLTFDRAVFDGTRFCRNDCGFCFVKQLPPGLRPGLYEKDDDYRLSFLHGNFISLTNLGPADRRRILTSRLSPLYVSLQAADPALRSRIFGNRRAASSLKYLEQMLDAGLEVHLQVVVCPGLNDGPALRRTLELVEERFSSTASLGLVPVGFTRFGPAAMRRVTREGARAVLELVREFQARWRERLGRRLVYASDEFYLAAGEDFPPADDYDEYPQLQNGIGLARKLIEEVTSAAAAHGRTEPCESLAVTGVAGAPVLQLALRAAGLTQEQARACLLPVPNRLFGPEVTVTGLVSGQDIVAAYRDTDAAGRRLLIPSSMLREDRFLDDMRVDELREALGTEMDIVEIDGGALLEALTSREVAA